MIKWLGYKLRTKQTLEFFLKCQRIWQRLHNERNVKFYNTSEDFAFSSPVQSLLFIVLLCVVLVLVHSFLAVDGFVSNQTKETKLERVTILKRLFRCIPKYCNIPMHSDLKCGTCTEQSWLCYSTHATQQTLISVHSQCHASLPVNNLTRSFPNRDQSIKKRISLQKDVLPHLYCSLL